MEVVAKLYKKAQEIAPISIKGEESLDHLNIPVTLEQVNQTMRDITSTINVIESRRVGEGRMNDIDSMMDGLRRLFNIKHCSCNDQRYLGQLSHIKGMLLIQRAASVASQYIRETSKTFQVH